jgi:hypothetical protein
MATEIHSTRILVRARQELAQVQLAFVAGKPLYVAARPFLGSIATQPNIGAASTPTWHLVDPGAELGENPWDICHRLVRGQPAMAAAQAIDFAEPDLQQRWLVEDPGPVGLQLAISCDGPEEQNAKYPGELDNYWMRDADHSAFPPPPPVAPGAAGVRIAHLDTGYGDTHKSKPHFLNVTLQRNFVDDGRPEDARDMTTGPFTNLGHGTGTLSILAGTMVEPGKPLGGAPYAEIVPVRVSDRVELFYNSAIAKAFDYVLQLCRNPLTRVDVITMSMGGLASQAWADAINALYEQGVFVVTAAGNNFGNLPTRNIVYPARFNRVVAACGVMANGQPYADLPVSIMAGNYGPTSKMATAMSAATPNTPWARIGCATIVDHDGNGTSAATPQIAATAALWIEKNRGAIDAYSEDWMRVEAVRQALFSTATVIATERHRLGHGALKAAHALDVHAPAAASLVKQPKDSVNFGFLNILLGANLGIVAGNSQSMLELEALQLSQSARVEAVLPDPTISPETLSSKAREDLREVLLAHPDISNRLREMLQIGGIRGPASGPPPRRAATDAAGSQPSPKPPSLIEAFQLSRAIRPERLPPARRRLRVFALDPSLGTEFSTAGINEAIIDVPWEDGLRPGPIGEYIEIIDVDPASRLAYAPVDLNAPYILADGGLPPSEGDPQFHQQMCYAVAMRTIEYFERALGRRALWAPRITRAAATVHETYIQRLRIYPHAIRAKNSFYSRELKALLLGYFSAPSFAGSGLPQGMTFSSLSHDIIAHETTHALLDGLHRRFSEATNPDVLAFHEAFADIVAIFQHFTMPQALKHAIRATRGNLQHDSYLSQLAIEFGQSFDGSFNPLRDALGKMEDGVYNPAQRTDYNPNLEAHSLGGVLLSAVFSTFVTIYQDRADKLTRLATGGSGVLASGDVPAALVDALADEASKVARQVLRMCIRALDYCPPIDITFGDYLRALITADQDLVPDDPRHYRVAFVAAFRDRGIYPSGVRHLSPGNLVWEPPPLPFGPLSDVLAQLSLNWDMLVDRRKAYDSARANAATFRTWLVNTASNDLLEALGFERVPGPMTIGDVSGNLHGIEVHSVRPARRIGPDGQSRTDLVIEITQTFYPESGFVATYRGGCTMLVDLVTKEVRYLIRKRLGNAQRLDGQMAYREGINSLSDTYYAEPPGGAEPFAILHRQQVPGETV